MFSTHKFINIFKAKHKRVFFFRKSAELRWQIRDLVLCHVQGSNSNVSLKCLFCTASDYYQGLNSWDFDSVIPG